MKTEESELEIDELPQESQKIVEFLSLDDPTELFNVKKHFFFSFFFKKNFSER